MAKQVNKAASNAETLAALIRKKFGDDRALVPSQKSTVEAISFGIEVLDRYIMGCGGMPRGRMVELFGDAGVGKTSLAYNLAARAQLGGGVVAWFDTERAFDAARAQAFGVDPDALVLVQPSTLEECADAMRTVVESNGAPKLLVWDSIAETPTEDEMTKGYGESVMGRRGQLVGRICSTLCSSAARSGTALLFVNQIREKIGVAFGDPITTPGGKGPKFFSSARVHLMGGRSVKDGNLHIGKDVVAYAMKNRFAPPRKARLRLLYETGWDDQWTTLELARELHNAVKGTTVEAARELLGWNAAENDTTKPNRS